MMKSIKEQASRPRYSTPWALTLLREKNISDSYFWRISGEFLENFWRIWALLRGKNISDSCD
jgi:hypothetical protein